MSSFHQGGNREEEISELEASLERLRSERMRRSAEKHEAGPSGVGPQFNGNLRILTFQAQLSFFQFLEDIRRDSTSSTVSSVKQVLLFAFQSRANYSLG